MLCTKCKKCNKEYNPTFFTDQCPHRNKDGLSLEAVRVKIDKDCDAVARIIAQRQ